MTHAPAGLTPDPSGPIPRPRASSATAIHVLLPVWGEQYVEKFLHFGLPTLLAPGNVPALARTLPCTVTLLTSTADAPRFHGHPTFRDLCAVCTTEIRLIDHLITGTNHSTTITLAYAEAVRASGPQMVDTCFVFLVADYIMADGSLARALDRIMAGSSAVLVGNFQVVLNDALPWLQQHLAGSPRSLAIPPREMMRWALSHLHPTTVANTVNFPLSHNEHTNRLFWRVDGHTLLGRFFLMHMLCIRPETTEFVVGSSCDYSFVPEMCPSNNVAVMTDSDEYLVIEMQPREHEAAFLRPGPLQPRALAKTLSTWTTARHRENARYSVVFHSEDVPSALSQTIAQADEFLATVRRAIKAKPKPDRGHPYWNGGIAAHKDATGELLAPNEWRLVLGLRMGWANDWLAKQLSWVFYSRPPRVRPWHPFWADGRPVLRRLDRFMRDPRQRLIMISDTPTIFTASLADGGERAVRVRRTPFLQSPAERYEPLRGQFDVSLIEVLEGELPTAGEVIDRISPMMKAGGEILVMVSNQQAHAGKSFTAHVGLEAARLMRPGATLVDVQIVPASRLRLKLLRMTFGLGRFARDNRWLGIPALAAGGGALTLFSGVANLVTRGRTKRVLRPRQRATSFLVVLRTDGSTPATPAGSYSAAQVSLDRRPEPTGTVAGPPPSTGAIDPPTAPLAAAPHHVNEPPSPGEGTREPQYNRCLELRDEVGVTQLGLMTNQVWHDDPRRLGILLSRYKFVAKMLSGRRDVGEVGCGDAFGTDVVAQAVGTVTAYDFDPAFIEDIRRRSRSRWPIEPRLHDILLGPLPRRHDGLYSLDVFEHIDPRDEQTYLLNLRASLTDHGVLILGTPSLESQAYASPPSRVGHVNCKSGPSLKALLEAYFQNVFLFSMNDEVVHTGFYPMAHYLLAICCGKRDGTV